MYIYEEGLHHIWQAQSRGIYECPLNLFKGLFLIFSLYYGFPFSPLWLHKGDLLRE
jgi:hypothetical protein